MESEQKANTIVESAVKEVSNLLSELMGPDDNLRRDVWKRISMGVNSIVGSDIELDTLSCVVSTFSRFAQIAAGYDSDVQTRNKWERTAYKHTQVLFNDMISELEKKATEKRETVSHIIQEISQLSTDLGMDPDVQEYQNSAKALVQLEVEVAAKVDDLRAEKNMRMAKFNCLREQEEILCEQMNEPVTEIVYQGIPHDDQVAELDVVVRNLNTLKVKRTQEMEDLKSNITTLLTELERSATSAIERDALSPSSPQLTRQNLESFRGLKDTLQKEVEANEAEATELWVKIDELWKRLKTDEEYCNAFSNSMVGSRPAVLKGLKKELYRCEEEKKANLQAFTEELRKELVALWDKCYVSAITKGGFFEMDFIEFTEDLLTAHENEVAKWKNFYETNHKIIDAFAQRGAVWAKWLELEAIEDDPTRLSNRGGALLKHEKEKKHTKKLLDKAESDIRKLDAHYLKDHGTHFTIRGIPIVSFVDEEKAIAAEERLDRKNMRKKLAEESKAFTPNSRKRGMPPTPVSAKRARNVLKVAQPVATTFLRTPNEKQTLKTKALGTPKDRSTTKFNMRNADDAGLISPASTYSEFTTHLKSTGLSSSIIQPLAGSRTATRGVVKMTSAAPTTDFANQF